MITRFILLIAIAFLLSTFCTNPFSTRDPEEPDESSTSTVFNPAIDPEIVLINFSRAMEQKNIEEYMKCFINPDMDAPHTFVYEPEQYFKNDIVDTWTLDPEPNYFNQLTKSTQKDYPFINLSFKDSLSLTPIITTSIDDSVESNSIEYELEVITSDSSSTYRGITRFKLFHSTSPPEHWHIYYWQDNAIDENYKSSWTYLKLYINKLSKK